MQNSHHYEQIPPPVQLISQKPSLWTAVGHALEKGFNTFFSSMTPSVSQQGLTQNQRTRFRQPQNTPYTIDPMQLPIELLYPEIPYESSHVPLPENIEPYQPVPFPKSQVDPDPVQQRLKIVEENIQKNTQNNISPQNNFPQTYQPEQSSLPAFQSQPNITPNQTPVDYQYPTSNQTIPLEINPAPSQGYEAMPLMKRQHQKEFDQYAQTPTSFSQQYVQQAMQPNRWRRPTLTGRKPEQSERILEVSRRIMEKKRLEKERRRKETPEAFYNGVDLPEKVSQKKALNDDELKQYFHYLNMKMHKARTPEEKQTVTQYIDQKKQELAWNMVNGDGAIKHPDGYIVIGRQAYGTAEALNKARENIEYFQEHGTHMPPLPYPIVPDDKNAHYLDVSQTVYEYIDRMSAIVISTEAGHDKVALLYNNFPNDRSWDLQVNHNLPGQLLIGLESKKYTDQYAVFNGDIRRSGYISNFAYGYVSAAAEISIDKMINIAEGLSILNSDKFNKKDEKQAAIDGWNSWHSRYKKY